MEELDDNIRDAYPLLARGLYQQGMGNAKIKRPPC